MTKSDRAAAPYRLKFLPEALDEWNALDGSVKTVLRKLLKKRLIEVGACVECGVVVD